MVWLWLAGVVIRLPVLWLPLLEPAAGLASQADFLAREQGAALDGHPLVPTLLLVIPMHGPWSPTLVLRVMNAALGALIAPLTAILFRKLGASRRQALLAGLLALLHPAVTLGAGGITPSTEAWATAFLLAGCILGFSESTGRRRVAAVCGLAAMASHPLGTLYGLLPLGLWIRREGQRVWLVSLPTAAALLLGFAPATLIATRGLPGRLSDAALWGLAVPAAVSIALLPGGLLALVRSGGLAGRFAIAWVLAALLGGLAAINGQFASVSAATDVSGSTWIPLFSMAVVLGGARLGRVAPGLRLGGLAGSLCLTAYLGLGALHLLLSPSSTAPVAEAMHRAKALDVAAQVAGPQGWIALDILHGEDAQQTSLSDLAGDARVWMVQTPSASTQASRYRRLYRFPAAGYPSDRHVAVVARAHPAPSRIQTFGGASIYQQEVVRRFGPYVVLRARRE